VQAAPVRTSSTIFCRVRTTVDERTGAVHDYTRKSDIQHSEIMAPEGAAEWSWIDLRCGTRLRLPNVERTLSSLAKRSLPCRASLMRIGRSRCCVASCATSSYRGGWWRISRCTIIPAATASPAARACDAHYAVYRRDWVWVEGARLEQR
jgi:hypothetical protein